MPFSLPLCTSATQIPPNATALIYKTINTDQFSHLETPILAMHKYRRRWRGKRWVMAELKRTDEEFRAVGLATKRAITARAPTTGNPGSIKVCCSRRTNRVNESTR
jgi:hypothetical protein